MGAIGKLDARRIVLLKHIRSRSPLRSRVTVKSQRDRHSKWAFGELRQFLTYKAKREGVPIMVIDPKDTSRECPKCHYVDKKNRNKNIFRCLQCEYSEMSDYVAALNIAAKAAIKQPIVTPLVVTNHLILIGGI